MHHIKEMVGKLYAKHILSISFTIHLDEENDVIGG